MWWNYSFCQLSFHVLDKHQLVNSLDSHFVRHYRDTWSWLRAPDHIVSVGFWERMMMMMMMMVNPVGSVVRQTWVRTELLSLEKIKLSVSVCDKLDHQSTEVWKQLMSFQFSREQQFPSQLSCRRSYEPPFTTSCLSFTCNHTVSWSSQHWSTAERFNTLFNLSKNVKDNQ